MLKEYKSIIQVAGPLVFLEEMSGVGFGEMGEIILQSGEKLNGQVLDVSEEVCVVQVFGPTTGIDVKNTRVRFFGETIKLGLSGDMLGRSFDGFGRPKDGLAEIVPEKRTDINSGAINPFFRKSPDFYLQTGVSAIDGMNTLVKGQKLPIFSGAGLPHNDLAVQIASQVTAEVVVFAAIGITYEEASFFMKSFERSGALGKSVLFLNLADDPSIERLITPRMALTTAEYFAFEKEKDVLVLLTDMTNYCEALREVASAREEVPGRRGYPGYMYTDLASIYERAGVIKGKKGSVTQFSILTMPGDDITHPIPDLTGYITEGQIVLGRDLHRKGIYPPIDVLPSLSRLMNKGIGKGKTREDHRNVADQMYSAYAEGRDLKALSAVVGEEALSARDKKFLKFAEMFEEQFVQQKRDEGRSIEQSLNIAWELLSEIPAEELKRVKTEYIDKYLKQKAVAEAKK